MVTSVLLWAGLGNCSLKIGSGGVGVYTAACIVSGNITPVVLQLRLASSASSCHLSGTHHNSLNASRQASERIHITSLSETKAGPPVWSGARLTLHLSRPCHLAILPNSLTRAKVPLFLHHYWDKMRSPDLEGGGGGAEIRWPVTPGGSARLFRSHPPLSN